MKDYIKPTFTLAGLFPVAQAASGCGFESKEMAEIFEFYGWEFSKQALAENEACGEKFPIEGYCKFTATDSMELKVFGS